MVESFWYDYIMTLTEVSYYGRRFFPLFLIFFLIILIFFYLFKIIFFYSVPNQKQSVYLNPLFGKISRPKINETATSSGKIDYIMDNVEGRPITATESAKVYYLPPTTPRFGYREKIYLIAKILGFDTEKIKHKLDNKEAIFNDGSKELRIDISNYNFSFEQKFTKDESIFTNTIIPSSTEIENKAISYLTAVGRYPDELAKGNRNIVYFSYNPDTNQMIPTQNINDANVVEVDFYRSNLEDFSVVSPRYFNSQNYVVMVFDDTSYKILRAQINFFEKSEDQTGIYPIKTGDQAFEDLVNAKAVIVSNLDKDKKSITIKKMFMSYLEPDIYQDYLQPVYVFLGENNFVAYVPAIRADYLTE